MTVTKSQINAVLKPLGLTQIRMRGSEYYERQRIPSRPYEYNGIRYRGIPAVSHSPLDVSSKSAEPTLDIIENEMEKLGLTRCENAYGMSFLIKETARSKSYVTFTELETPTYVAAMGRDPDYRTTWIVVEYSTDKKSY